MSFKVPIEWAEKSVQAMKGMGFTSVNFKRFSGMGHESHPEVKLTFLIIFVFLLTHCSFFTKEMSDVDDLITKVCP